MYYCIHITQRERGRDEMDRREDTEEKNQRSRGKGGGGGETGRQAGKQADKDRQTETDRGRQAEN